MGRKPKGEPEYKPHPYLEEQRPPLKESARRRLKKSIKKIGMMNPIIATQDGYILDGRARYEICKELKMVSIQVKELLVWSGLEDTPASTPEEELEACKEVIHETGRHSWKQMHQSRDKDVFIGGEQSQPTDKDIFIGQEPTDKDILISEEDAKLERLQVHCESMPCDSTLHLKVPKLLLEFILEQAEKNGHSAVRGRGAVKITSGQSYVRHLIWKEYLAELRS